MTIRGTVFCRLAVAFCLIFPILSGIPDAALARSNFAILIGAADYPNLDERFWLNGPGNDVALVENYLKSNPAAPFEADKMMVLADRVPGALPPTLENIRAAFADLADRVAPGDFVYLHFAGHGSQAPSTDPTSELDGLDELFLPSDIGVWDDGVGRVKNALVDDEIGAMIDRLRAKDATVWAVFDSCHSGTVTRGAPTGGDDVRMRKITPASLGIPQARLDEVEPPVSRGLPPRDRPSEMIDSGATASGGSLVAFYAAQSTETTPEMRLPAGKKGRQAHGLFTWTIFEVLAEYPGMTYRQLGQEVLRRYSAQYLVQPTPLFDGDLDRTVFDVGPSEAIRQWPVSIEGEEIQIPAGQLHQLSEGDYLALLAGPVEKSEDTVGYLKVISATGLTSALVPAEHEGLPALSIADIGEGFYARRVEAGFDFALNVAMPSSETISPDILALADAAIEKVAEYGGAGLRVKFVAAGESADIRLAILDATTIEAGMGDPVLDHHLWLLPPTGDVTLAGNAKSPSINLSGKSSDEAGEALADNLTRIARATNLLKLGGTFSASGLDVPVSLQTRNKAQPELASMDPASVSTLIPGDEVHIKVQNRMDIPVDMNVLYVGSDYSISHMYSGRVQPGDIFSSAALRITDGSFGKERMLVVVSPAKPQTAVEDLRFLAQNAVPATRGVASSNFRGMLTEAGFGTRTRGAAPMMDSQEGPAGAIMQFDFDIEPERPATR